MVFKQGARLFHRAKGLASGAYAFAHEAAPNIQKAADFAKKGYAYGRDSGLIDRYGGRNAGAIHGMAQKGLDGYERLERAARDADGVIQAMR
jgi:hypothetical protein